MRVVAVLVPQTELIFRGQGLVADQAVRPQVRHPDLQIIVAGPHQIGDVGTVRLFPNHGHGPAIDHDLGEDFDASEIEDHAAA